MSKYISWALARCKIISWVEESSFTSEVRGVYISQHPMIKQANSDAGKCFCLAVWKNHWLHTTNKCMVRQEMHWKPLIGLNDNPKHKWPCATMNRYKYTLQLARFFCSIIQSQLLYFSSKFTPHNQLLEWTHTREIINQYLVGEKKSLASVLLCQDVVSCPLFLLLLRYYSGPET